MLTTLILTLTPPGASPMETQAIQKAMEAAYIQSGASALVNQVQNQSTEYAKRQGERLGVTKYVGILGGGYQVYKTQSLTFHLSHSTVATVRPDFSSVTFTF